MGIEEQFARGREHPFPSSITVPSSATPSPSHTLSNSFTNFSHFTNPFIEPSRSLNPQPNSNLLHHHFCIQRLLRHHRPCQNRNLCAYTLQVSITEFYPQWLKNP
ncbi:Uncharacterized protein Fot_55966 [Forsythia ovata]|uniref:Uncharacterized protein n=1 Tax=Forsythia ovata TaxID=205694 RepID=A0ABD1P207_9LAMI